MRKTIVKNPGQAVWSRTTGWAAAVVALAATVVLAPSAARAACVGDCNGDNQVTVNELIQMVNIALGSAAVTTCTAGDANNDGEITVNEIVAGVNNALNDSCPTTTLGVCGDGIKNGDEECDPGSLCIGGTNAGTVCTKESDCQGEGVCDTFGQQGNPGTVARKACSADSECGGAKCIHCKRFGGAGCAVNCTLETADVIQLVPGEIEGQSVTPGTSGAIVTAEAITIPLSLSGSNTLIRGNEKNGLIPTTQKAVGHCSTTTSMACNGNGYCPAGETCITGINLPRVPVSTLACACVRASEYKTCGGTQFEADGITQSTNCTELCDATGCTSRASLCDGKKPCTSVAGPGNSGEGVIGCTSLPLVSYAVVQDAGGVKCAQAPGDPVNPWVCVDERYQLQGGVKTTCFVNGDCPAGGTCGCVDAKLPVFTPATAGGGPGSQILATASAIGSTTGLCVGSGPAYGPDGEFCTSDDPVTSRGTTNVVTLVTGTASGTVVGPEGNPAGPQFDIGPVSISGNPLTCDKVIAGTLAGAAQAGAFTALDQPTTGDEVVTNVFASQ